MVDYYAVLYFDKLLNPARVEVPQNFSVDLVEQRISLSWDYIDLNNVSFVVTCENEMVTVSTLVSDNDEVHIDSLVLLPNSEYNCCVKVTTVDGDSESVCENVIAIG